MFNRNCLYKLDISGLVFWQKVQDDASQDFREVYRKVVCEKGTLLLDKMGNPKSMPEVRGSYYIDLVTGRVFVASLVEEQFTIENTSVVCDKERLTLGDGSIYREAAEVLDGEHFEDYMRVSEALLSEGYFCNRIAEREGIEEIPVCMVEEEILKTRKELFSEEHVKRMSKGLK